MPCEIQSANTFSIQQLFRISDNMLEKLCLQRNDYHENTKIVFGNLREDNNFADVTLACEDGQQVEAHKVILAASSPFFQKLLGRKKHPHPLIYMRGVKYDDLLAIMDFLYIGEANVYQENLDSFLVTAEELQLKGLIEKTEERVENFKVSEEAVNFEVNEKAENIEVNEKAEVDEKPLLHVTNTNEEIQGVSNGQISSDQELEENRTVATRSYFSGDLQELEEMVKSMMEKSENYLSYEKKKAFICKLCGKEGARKEIEAHIEFNHLEGIIIPCNLCHKTFRSRNGCRQHKARIHD